MKTLKTIFTTEHCPSFRNIKHNLANNRNNYLEETVDVKCCITFLKYVYFDDMLALR